MDVCRTLAILDKGVELQYARANVLEKVLVLPIDMHGLPKLEGFPCRGVLKRIRGSRH